VPAYDGMASLCNLLELLAPVDRPLSEIVGELPESAVVHHQVRCPWARKGAVMRILTERTKGKEVDVTDGIKVYDERGWAQVLPDPDEPLVHIYAEGKTAEDGASLESEFLGLVEEIVAWEDEAEDL
jgi:mannose-1-phosphate guanylyltransferase / phosphomannomutase